MTNPNINKLREQMREDIDRLVLRFLIGESYDWLLDSLPTLFADNMLEVIGEDDTEVRGTTQNPDNPNYWTKRTKYRNDLRQEQREKLQQLFGMENTKDE